MARAHSIQTNFTAGEISPTLYGRTDIARYQNGCKKLENMAIMPQGGAIRRSGTRYVAAVKTESKATRLLPFVFSEEQAYVIEFGDLYFRFFMDEGQILKSPLIVNGTFNTDLTGWTTGGANWESAHQYTGTGGAAEMTGGETMRQMVPGCSNSSHTLTWTWTSNVGGGSEMQVKIGTTLGASDIATGSVTTAGVLNNTFDPPANGSVTFTPPAGDVYISFEAQDYGYLDTIVLTSDPYEVAHTYTEAELADVKFTQSADILYLVHPNHKPAKLSRTGHRAWTLSDIDFLDGPYEDLNTITTSATPSTATITPSAATGAGVTLTASSAIFQSSDVGRLVRLKHSSKWGSAKITGYTSTTVVTATVQNTLDPNRKFWATTAASEWRLGTWGTELGYPGVVTFNEGRLFFANSSAYPQTEWGSVIGDFETFSPTMFDDSATNDLVTDDAALTYTNSTDRVNAIRWMVELANAMGIGTKGGEFLLKGAQTQEALTPTNVRAKRQTTIGCSKVNAIPISSNVLFVQRSGKKLYEYIYSFERDGFISNDVTILAAHVLKSGAVDAAYTQEPFGIAWYPVGNGELVGLTYLKDQEVQGFHRHRLGGAFGTTEWGVVESVAAIPSPNEDHDQLWLIVKRTINGATHRYIEFMEEFFDGADATLADAFFVDCGLSYNDEATETISGLSHLEGQTVSVLVDGAAHPDRTVSGGSISLQLPGEVVHVGLSCPAMLRSIDYETGANFGTAQAKNSRINEIAVRFNETLGAKVGTVEGELDIVGFRSPSDPMDAPPPLFSGDKIMIPPADYSRNREVVVMQEQPLPMTVLAIMPKIVVYE